MKIAGIRTGINNQMLTKPQQDLKTLILIFLIFALILILCKVAGARDWDTTDKILFGAYTACHFADYLQTRQIIEEDNELNPVIVSLADEMGHQTGVAFYFAATTALTYLISNWLDSNRQVFLGIMAGSSGSTVFWNIRMGYSF